MSNIWRLSRSHFMNVYRITVPRTVVIGVYIDSSPTRDKDCAGVGCSRKSSNTGMTSLKDSSLSHSSALTKSPFYRWYSSNFQPSRQKFNPKPNSQ